MGFRRADAMVAAAQRHGIAECGGDFGCAFGSASRFVDVIVFQVDATLRSLALEPLRLSAHTPMRIESACAVWVQVTPRGLKESWTEHQKRSARCLVGWSCCPVQEDGSLCA